MARWTWTIFAERTGQTLLQLVKMKSATHTEPRSSSGVRVRPSWSTSRYAGTGHRTGSGASGLRPKRCAEAGSARGSVASRRITSSIASTVRPAHTVAMTMRRRGMDVRGLPQRSGPAKDVRRKDAP